MSFMIVSGRRVPAGKESEYIALSEQLRGLLGREGRGLRSWTVARSSTDPGVFGGVTVWASREEEQRMVNHPERLALVEAFKPFLAERVAGVAGPVILELVGIESDDEQSPST